MIKRYSSIVLLFLCQAKYSASDGQPTLQPIFPEVSKSDRFLKHPFAGGLNSGQFNEIDADDDGDMDLIVFDRASEIVMGFENNGDVYEYNPALAKYFPRGLEHWVKLIDYDCDGRNDLFTNGNLGVKVYKNLGRGEWELIADPLFTRGLSGPVNALFNSSDISSIEDIDGDGDLDMLYFNFVNGDFLEHHKNFSMERTGSCGLDFERVNQKYGSTEVCACDDFSFGEQSCHLGSKIFHLSGKSLLSVDQNGDGLMDLVIGQESCEDLNLLLNKGSASEAVFNDFNNVFPSMSSALSESIFPAAFYLDVNFDGAKDLIVAQNIRSDGARIVDFASTTRLFANSDNRTFSVSVPFLQDEMIDVGEIAYPSFADVDGDGDQDLLIGAKNSPTSANPPGIHYYHKRDSGFIFVTDDLFGLRQLELDNIISQFIDIDKDGSVDFIVSAFDSSGQNVFGYWLNRSDVGIQFDLAAFNTFSIALNTGDDFQLLDLDRDGQLDLLVGNVFGELAHYRNQGNFNFVLEDLDILNLENSLENLNLSMAAGDVNGDETIELLTTRRSGEVTLFTIDSLEATEIQLLFDNELLIPRMGRKSKPAIGQLDGKRVIAIGTIGGGVRLYSVEHREISESMILEVFPNPSPNGIYNIKSNQTGGRLIMTDLAGNTLVKKKIENDQTDIRLDLSEHEAGVYLIIRKAEADSKCIRIVIQ